MIADRILATQSDIAEYQALLSQRDGLLVSVEDLKNQILTAELQHGNDQQVIDDLKAKLTQAQSDLAKNAALINVLNAQITGYRGTIDSLQAQLAALPQAAIGSALEYGGEWSMNWNAIVGGSGKGSASQDGPDRNGWATFSITPDAPIAVSAGGTGKNNFDCYYTKTFKGNDSKKTFQLVTDWKFDTLADATASNCLEMEARPIYTDGRMSVIACQLDFADNALRYYTFDASVDKGHWVSTGVPQPRLVPGQVYMVTLDGHRDDTTVYTDAITINKVVTKVGKSYPLFNKKWGGSLKCSLQLDGNSKGDAYKARYRNVNYI